MIAISLGVAGINLAILLGGVSAAFLLGNHTALDKISKEGTKVERALTRMWNACFDDKNSYERSLGATVAEALKNNEVVVLKSRPKETADGGNSHCFSIGGSEKKLSLVVFPNPDLKSTWKKKRIVDPDPAPAMKTPESPSAPGPG